VAFSFPESATPSTLVPRPARHLNSQLGKKCQSFCFGPWSPAVPLCSSCCCVILCCSFCNFAVFLFHLIVSLNSSENCTQIQFATDLRFGGTDPATPSEFGPGSGGIMEWDRESQSHMSTQLAFMRGVHTRNTRRLHHAYDGPHCICPPHPASSSPLDACTQLSIQGSIQLSIRAA
jgi:hypothetical protein